MWTDECETAFRTLKKALVSSPILAFPEEKGQNFILDCDASNVAAGSMLSQIQNGEEKVIAYFSKCFSNTEEVLYYQEGITINSDVHKTLPPLLVRETFPDQN